MKRRLVSGISTAAALMAMFGPGLAGANNELNGMTYAKAQEKVSSFGNIISIATKTGSYLAMDDCMVVGTRKADFLDSSGRKPSNTTWLVDLNCNDLSALNGHPGNSAASPEGKKVQVAVRQSYTISKDYAKATAAGTTPVCFRDDGGGSTRWCVQVCTTSKSCSPELNAALGI